MDIESSNNSPYYLPNKNIPNNGKFIQGNPLQGRQGGMNQSQNVSANFSNLSINNNMSLSQMNPPNMYGQPGRINQVYNQQMQPPQMQQNNLFNNYNQNYNQQNYPPNYPQSKTQNYPQNYNNLNNNPNYNRPQHFQLP